MIEKISTCPVYLDTNVFIAAVEGDVVISNPVQRLFEFLRRTSRCVTTSELTLAELLAPHADKSNSYLDQRRALYLDFMLNNEFLNLHAVTRDIIIATADVRKGNRLKLADAIHFATAIELHANYFLSFDRDARRLPSIIEAVEPTDAGIDRVLMALNA